MNRSSQRGTSYSRREFLAATTGSGLLSCIASPILLDSTAHGAQSTFTAKEPVDIAGRWELFVDDWLVDWMREATLKLHSPERREIVLTTDAPWEDRAAAYFSVVKHGSTIRLYYRGAVHGSDLSEHQVTCVAESQDGIHFTRPILGLIEVNGSKANNVIWKGIEAHNLAVFYDANPNCPPSQRYKALGGLSAPGRNWLEGDVALGLYAFVSEDGLRWKKLQKNPVITEGAFDSLNLAFWDTLRGRYYCYSRTMTGNIRTIQSSFSDDFISWSSGVPNEYADGVPLEHFYTNATVPCPGAEHILLSFPKRFLPDRKKVAEFQYSGVSDAVFMSSRDGIHWDRPFLEAWVRPGRDQRNWTARSMMPAFGIVETATDEWSLYISEHYEWPDNCLRRYSIPRHRIASVSAGARSGELTTRLFRFEGTQLQLNYSTSAAGAIQVEIQSEDGTAIPGFSLPEMNPICGDQMQQVVSWKTGADLSSLQGKYLRLRILLHDADLFALRFVS